MFRYPSLDHELRDRLKKLGTAKHRSPHWIMREAIREYVEREEEAEKLRQETIERWKAYKKDGKHVSNEAMIAWLDTWGTDKEAGRTQRQ
ncbi:MAG TPA: ribbon-helix-helix protein, CopG family [Thermodesulfobacteriota bacterium]|nr:ribbon-helix-helix protein, CopG family [Thermodesulfobacteriota bacterium]